MKTPITFLKLLAVGLGMLASTGLQAADKPEVEELRYLSNLSRVSYAELAEHLGYLEPLRLKHIGVATGGPQVLQAIATRDVDFGQSFNGSLLNLRAAGAKLKAVIATTGTDANNGRGLYVLENSPIQSAQDLVGKKVGVNTRGALFEFIVKQYLKQNGVSAADAAKVTLVPLPYISAEQSLREGVLDAVVFEDIFVEKAKERGGLRLLQGDFEILGEFQSASTILHEDFIKNNPNATRLFVEGTAKAIEWVNAHEQAEVIDTFKQIIRERKRQNETDDVVDFWRGFGVSQPGGRIQPKEFSLLLEWLIEDGQIKPGAIQASDAWTNEFNPYTQP